MRMMLVILKALGGADENWPLRRRLRSRKNVGRRNSDGTTETTISASVTHPQSPVTVMPLGSGKPGRNCLFSLASIIS